MKQKNPISISMLVKQLGIKKFDLKMVTNNVWLIVPRNELKCINCFKLKQLEEQNKGAKINDYNDEEVKRLHYQLKQCELELTKNIYFRITHDSKIN